MKNQNTASTKAISLPSYHKSKVLKTTKYGVTIYDNNQFQNYLECCKSCTIFEEAGTGYNSRINYKEILEQEITKRKFLIEESILDWKVKSKMDAELQAEFIPQQRKLAKITKLW